MADTRVIFKVWVAVDDGNPPQPVDAFEHEGRVWIVLWWIEMPGAGVRFPQRTIPLDSLPHQPQRNPIALAKGVRFLLTHEVHRELFDPLVPPEIAAAYVLVDMAHLPFDTPARPSP